MLEYLILLESTKRGCVCSWACSQGRGEADGTIRDIKIWSRKWATTPRSERTSPKQLWLVKRCSSYQKKSLALENKKNPDKIQCWYWLFLLQPEEARKGKGWRKIGPIGRYKVHPWMYSVKDRKYGLKKVYPRNKASNNPGEGFYYLTWKQENRKVLLSWCQYNSFPLSWERCTGISSRNFWQYCPWGVK